MRKECNKYLFHWLSSDSLLAFDRTGKLKPAWRHWLPEEGRFAKGISTCEEPMLWNPDEELPREPCLVIDRKTVGHAIHPLRSSEAYHLTREIERVRRKKGDVDEVLDRWSRMRRFTHSAPDEMFVEGPLSWDNVVALGFEEDGTQESARPADLVRDMSERRGLPYIDLTGWKVGSPGVMETDGIVDEAVAAVVRHVRQR